MKYPNGHEFEFRYLRPSEIRVDQLYQRELDIKRVDRIADNFDGDIFSEPKVSYRDGVYWVFDGQHSIAAWRKVNDGADKPVYCKVFKGMTWLEECDAFIKQNGISKDPTTNDKLRAGFNSKNPDVIDMVNKAELCGFVVDFAKSKTPTRIVATSTLFKAHQMLSEQAFLDMMTVIRDAWYGDVDAVCQQIISGMAVFFKTYYGNFKCSDLVSSLKRVTPAAIIRRGMSHKNRGNTYTREILEQYNTKRSRNRLDVEKL